MISSLFSKRGELKYDSSWEETDDRLLLIVPLLKQGEKIYEHTNRTVNVVADQEIMLKPRSCKQLRITFDTEEPVHLKPNKRSPMQFEECIINPWIGNSADVVIHNHGHSVFHINHGELLGNAAVVKLPLEEETFPTDNHQELELGAPEADWTQKLPQLPKTESEFIEEIHVKETIFSPLNRQKLVNLIILFKATFFNEDGKIGHFLGPIQHSIKLISPLPRPRKTRIPYGKREEINRQVQQLLKQGVIEVSNSTFTSPIVLVKKKDSTFRFTVDYRMLNAVSEKRNYQIPNITELLDMATGSFISSSFDFISGFFQIDLKKEDRHLTAFATEEETYQFQRMPMGVSGAPFTFQQVARYLQKSMKARVFTYLDDILLVSSSEEEHLEDIKELLENVVKNGLKLKLKKCVFARKELEFLGYVIGRDGLKPNPKKTEAIQNFPVPTNATAVRSFIGMIGYFRRFIKNFAGIAAPLHSLTEKDKAFEWKEIHQHAFEELKTALVNPPILAGPNLNKPYVLETDASSFAIAAVLLQKNDDGLLNVISFASRKLSKAEAKYPPIEGEALAVLFGLQHYRQYLLGNHTLIVTDHQPLTSLLKRKNLEGRLLKYQIMIQEFDIEFLYRPGRQNVVADALSRYLPDDSEAEQPLVMAVQTEDPTAGITLEEVINAQSSAKWINEAIEAIQSMDESRKGVAWRSRFALENGTLRHRSTKSNHLPFVIPIGHPLTKRIIQKFHESRCSHLGSEKTLEMIKRYFQWTSMKAQVVQEINRCILCRRIKTDRHQTTKEPMGPVDKVDTPVSHWHIDHCGPLPITEKGNRFILVFRDPFTKYLVTAPVPNQNAETTSDVFIERILAIHGTPKSITTDCGTSFCSELFGATLKKFGVVHRKSAPYHHESNGIVERANRTIEEALSTYVNQTQSDWDNFLPLVTFAINATISKTTGLCPYQMLFGRLPPLPEDNLLRTYQTFGDDYQSTLENQLNLFWTMVKNRHTVAQEDSQRTKQKQIKVGDAILMRRARPPNKLAPRLLGGIVGEVVGKNVIVDVKGKKKMAHKNDIRILPSSEPEGGKPVAVKDGAVRRSERIREKIMGRE
ncbi:hypothetical protein CRE_23798 [Caenorhabditis remanei]|uniref:RNA-directed DNA polymerase n=1 Tax=Caenorhabditis remanei TaxID=31234 RepID=E3NNE6_CAERE|nr:hypothetical protein CRE_23798 [Caenorhabditis remanei]